MPSTPLSLRAGFGDALLLGSRETEKVKVLTEGGVEAERISLWDPATLKVNPGSVGE